MFLIIKYQEFQSYHRKLHIKNKILNDSQYGFRNHRSTAMTIKDLIQCVSDHSISKKETSNGYFHRFKKAFNTIDHEILILKIIIMLYEEFLKRWIQSYLK